MAAYKLIGVNPLALPDGQWVEPEEEFEADLKPELESFLFEIGAIEKKVQPKAAAVVRPIPGVKE